MSTKTVSSVLRKYRWIFRLAVWWAKPALRKAHAPQWLEAVLADTWDEFKGLEPQIPNIGQRNVWKYNLVLSALYLSLLRAALKHGASPADAVQLLYDFHEAVAASLPRWLRRTAGRYWNSPTRRNALRAGAVRSQLREYPADWVFTYNEGDGRSTPFGVDISECAILKYYRTLGEEVYVSALCRLDYFIGKALYFRFERDGTLVEGYSMCDCRYYLDRETTDWNPRLNPDQLFTKEKQ